MQELSVLLSHHLTMTRQMPFPADHRLTDTQHWGHQSRDAKWIELWMGYGSENQPEQWNRWEVTWLYNPQPHIRGSQWRPPTDDHFDCYYEGSRRWVYDPQPRTPDGDPWWYDQDPPYAWECMRVVWWWGRYP